MQAFMLEIIMVAGQHVTATLQTVVTMSRPHLALQLPQFRIKLPLSAIGPGLQLSKSVPALLATQDQYYIDMRCQVDFRFAIYCSMRATIAARV